MICYESMTNQQLPPVVLILDKKKICDFKSLKIMVFGKANNAFAVDNSIFNKN